MTAPAKTPRPLSPHLQIYNMFRISSLTSITHRLTGVGLVFGAVIAVWWLMAIAHGQKSYDCFLKCVASPFGTLVLIGMSWAFWYHLVNGLRHLAWDTGAGFSGKVYPVTGKLALIGSVVLTAATWFYIWSL